MGRYNTAFIGVTLTVLVGLGVSSCASDDDSAADSLDAPQIDAEAPVGAESAPGRSGVDESGESADTTAGELTPGTPLPTDQALATTAGVTVATSDIRTAVDDTLVAVQRNGASVFTADVNIGDERDDGSVDGSGYFVVKVPPADLEALITDLGATVGRLSGRTQDTTDVTDQLVDLDIRIGVERDVIARFQNLLEAATEFQDIVEIERVISERTIALEQLLASQRNLDNRVDRSTLTIQLQYEAPTSEVTTAADEPTDGIAGAWRTGWDVFLGALFAIGFVLAVAAPFLVTALVVLAVVWLVSRRRRGPAVAAATPAAPPTTDTDAVSSDERLAEPTRQG
jgi:uncharacterized membrane protein